jgi:hypothetical protein
VGTGTAPPSSGTRSARLDPPRASPWSSRYGQAVSSVHTQAWQAKHLQPDATGTWRPTMLERDGNLSSYFCSGYAETPATPPCATTTSPAWAASGRAYGGAMWRLIGILLVVWLVLTVIGAVVKGLFWLAVVGALFFAATTAIGWAKRNGQALPPGR